MRFPSLACYARMNMFETDFICFLNKSRAAATVARISAEEATEQKEKNPQGLYFTKLMFDLQVCYVTMLRFHLALCTMPNKHIEGQSKGHASSRKVQRPPREKKNIPANVVPKPVTTPQVVSLSRQSINQPFACNAISEPIELMLLPLCHVCTSVCII